MFFDNCTLNIITTSVALLGLIYYFLKWRANHWQRNNIPTFQPVTNPLLGDTPDMFFGKVSFGTQFKIFYDTFKSRGCKYGGAYFLTKRVFLPIDIELVKNIMQKDFVHFMNHGGYVDEKNDPLGAHLFNLEDAKWRNMRVKLTPTFTSGKMKMMFQTVADSAVGLKDILGDAIGKKDAVEIKDVLGRFTTDVIGSTAFGIDCNSLKDPNTDFRIYGKKVFDFNTLQMVKAMLTLALPRWLLSFFGFRFTKGDVEKFFTKIMRDTVRYREQNNIYRKDFMHLLLQLKNRGNVQDDEKIMDTDGVKEHALTMNELYAQAFVFFIAGFETSSTLMTWTLYELAINPEIQEKLRDEIKTVLDKHDNKLTYEAMMEMTYMDHVLDEALRKYPPLPLLTRICTKEYLIPGTNCTLQKDDLVMISTLGIQNDPEYYPNPEKFDPDRFTEENKQKRPAFSWIPFGEGPRLCIGLRFGLMQSKVGLATLLRDYRFKLSSKTQTPVKMSTKEFISTAEGGIWLDVEKTTKS